MYLYQNGAYGLTLSLLSLSIQLNLHQTNLLFRYLSHHLTWHFSSIYEDLHRYARKIVFVIVACLKLFRNNNKNNFASISVQIFANLHKSRNNTMSNDGLIIENMDLSHIHLAVSIISKIWISPPHSSGTSLLNSPLVR